MNGTIQIPTPRNEPIKGYAPGSPERASIRAALKTMGSEQVEIPLIIGGKEVRTGNLVEIRAGQDLAPLTGFDTKIQSLERSDINIFESNHNSVTTVIRPSKMKMKNRLCMTAMVVVCGISVIEVCTRRPW